MSSYNDWLQPSVSLAELTHTFSSRLVINPDQSGLVTTSSQDGTVKVWSLHAMELFYSLNVFSSGIDWMNITNDNIVWCATEKKVGL